MGHSGRSSRGEGKQMEKEGPSHRIQDECCYVCGHEGFSELLIFCSDCSQLAVHKYCFGIIPGSIEDTEGVYWACNYCRQSLNSSSSDQPDNVLTENSERKSKSYKTEIILVEEQPKPLCTLFPEGYQNSSEQAKTEEEFQPFVSYVMEHPTEISRGVVLLVSPSGEIIACDETSLLDDRFTPINMASSEGVIIT